MPKKGPAGRGRITSGSSFVPPSVTHAESYYYSKQIDAGTDLVAVLVGGEKLSGRLVWYDTSSLGFQLRGGNERVVAKEMVKYIYKSAKVVSARRPNHRAMS